MLVGEFSACPVYPPTPGLELALEVQSSTPASLATFRDAFDASLKEQNADYTTKRTDGVGMAAPTITPLPMGAFYRWMDSRGKLGGQHKCPRCANHREIVDGVKEVVARV